MTPFPPSDSEALKVGEVSPTSGFSPERAPDVPVFLGCGTDWLGLHFPTSAPATSELAAAFVERVAAAVERGPDPQTGRWDASCLAAPSDAPNPRAGLSPVGGQISIYDYAPDEENEEQNRATGETPALGVTGAVFSPKNVELESASAGTFIPDREQQREVEIARGINGFRWTVVLASGGGKWYVYVPSIKGLDDGKMGIGLRPSAEWLATHAQGPDDAAIVEAYASALLRWALGPTLQLDCRRCGHLDSEHLSLDEHCTHSSGGGLPGSDTEPLSRCRCNHFDAFNVNRYDWRADFLMPHGLPAELVSLAERQLSLGEVASATKMPKRLRQSIRRYAERHPDATVRLESPLVSRARTRTAFKVGDTLGLRIGKSEIVARFYDKLAEALQDHDLDFWLAVLGLPARGKRQKRALPAAWRDATVMRVEFQFRKAYLKDFGPTVDNQPLEDRTLSYVLAHKADYLLPLLEGGITTSLVPSEHAPFAPAAKRVDVETGEVLEMAEVAGQLAPWLGFYTAPQGKDHHRSGLPWWMDAVEHVHELAFTCARCRQPQTEHPHAECLGYIALLAGDGARRDPDRIRQFESAMLLDQAMGCAFSWKRRECTAEGKETELSALVEWDPVRQQHRPMADVEVLRAGEATLDAFMRAVRQRWRELTPEERREVAIKDNALQSMLRWASAA